MEFENLGVHCEVSSCNQRDFLPFKCDVCKRTLCLDHRSYNSHDCTGASVKDMTSLDCPICGLSIKLTKADDPNAIWENHFALKCSQRSQNNVTGLSPGTCFVSDCRKLLGPSDTFSCQKCHKKYCSSHRIPEEHSCRDARGLVPLARQVPPKSNNKPVNKPVTAASSSKRPSRQTGNVDQSNTIYGTAERRKKSSVTDIANETTTPINNTTNYMCPLCNQNISDYEALQIHVAYEHSEGETSLPSSTSRPNNSIENIEVAYIFIIAFMIVFKNFLETIGLSILSCHVRIC